jgi:hypothetical protein
MRRFVRGTLISLALGVTAAACNSPRTPKLITGDDAAVAPTRGSSDALWMIALPPVTVYARRPPRAMNDSLGARREFGARGP